MATWFYFQQWCIGAMYQFYLKIWVKANSVKKVQRVSTCWHLSSMCWVGRCLSLYALPSPWIKNCLADKLVKWIFQINFQSVVCYHFRIVSEREKRLMYNPITLTKSLPTGARGNQFTFLLQDKSLKWRRKWKS